MRIRKRTPARAASPPPPSPPPPPLPLQQQPTEKEHKEDEEKRAILAAGEDDERVRFPAAAASWNRISRTTDDVPKPEPDAAAAAAADVRCSRNDGKRWRCKKAAVPGYLFCDRHIAWSTRKRKPRANKPKSHGTGVLGLGPGPTTTIISTDFAEDHHHQGDAGFFDGF